MFDGNHFDYQGTGSFGHKHTETLLARWAKPKNHHLLNEMSLNNSSAVNLTKAALRAILLAIVRDAQRLSRAMYGVDQDTRCCTPQNTKKRLAEYNPIDVTSILMV
jgi:UDP-N-acetylglucosamine 4,6-dehydratase